jgi:hypothetical protein
VSTTLQQDGGGRIARVQTYVVELRRQERVRSQCVKRGPDYDQARRASEVDFFGRESFLVRPGARSEGDG